MSATVFTAGRRRATVRREGLGVAAQHLLLGVVPLLLTVGMFYFLTAGHWAAYDFDHAYYPAVLRLLHGASPYAFAHRDIAGGTAFVYPALSALVLAPFGLLHAALANDLYRTLCIAMALGTLSVLGVRDWRVYGASLLLPAVNIGWQGGNVSVPLGFMVALTWRYRERPLVAGLLTAAAISIKPFMWPLVLWLLVTRRFKATAATVGWAVLLNLIAWGVLGFDEIHTYMRLSGEVTAALWHGGYSMLAVAGYLGLGRGAGEGLLLLVSAFAAGAVIYVGWIRRDERAALALTVALMLVASPLVWNHYFVLMLIPLALYRPRFTPLWLVSLPTWVCPPSQAVSGWQCALLWIVAAGTIAWLLKPRLASLGNKKAPFGARCPVLD